MPKIQKSLIGFTDNKVEEKVDVKSFENEKKDKFEIEEVEEIIESSKEIRKANQIETDYYDKSRVEICASRLRERFHVNIDINEVRYGSKPPLNEKIYGYYMLITIKSGDKERIVEFIRNECKLKVYN